MISVAKTRNRQHLYFLFFRIFFLSVLCTFLLPTHFIHIFLIFKYNECTLIGVQFCEFWQVHRVVQLLSQSRYRLFHQQLKISAWGPCASNLLPNPQPGHQWHILLPCSSISSRVSLNGTYSTSPFKSGFFHLSKCILDSFMSLCVSAVYLFGIAEKYLIILMHHIFKNPFTSWRTWGYFQFAMIMNNQL